MMLAAVLVDNSSSILLIIDDDSRAAKNELLDSPYRKSRSQASFQLFSNLYSYSYSLPIVRYEVCAQLLHLSPSDDVSGWAAVIEFRHLLVDCQLRFIFVSHTGDCERFALSVDVKANDTPQSNYIL